MFGKVKMLYFCKLSIFPNNEKLQVCRSGYLLYKNLWHDFLFCFWNRILSKNTIKIRKTIQSLLDLKRQSENDRIQKLKSEKSDNLAPKMVPGCHDNGIQGISRNFYQKFIFGMKANFYAKFEANMRTSTYHPLVGWLVVLRINVDLAIFQPYLDLEAGDNQSLKIQVARPGIEPRSSCSASQELNHSATTAPYITHCMANSFSNINNQYSDITISFSINTNSITNIRTRGATVTRYAP